MACMSTLIYIQFHQQYMHIPTCTSLPSGPPIHLSTHTHSHTHTHGVTNMQINMHTHTHTYTHLQSHTHTRSYTHTVRHTHANVYIHTHTHTHIATEPKILNFQPEIHANEGEQVTLRVNFTGTPKPTITWTFKGTNMEGDYATELGTDGSLLFVCVGTKHAGRYMFSSCTSFTVLQATTQVTMFTI